MSLLDTHERALALCTYCPTLCRHVCPVEAAEGRDTLSPWGKMSLAGHVRSGRVAISPEVAEVFYACMGCGACQVACSHGNDVAEALFAARRLAVAQGAGPGGPEGFEHDEFSTAQCLIRGVRTAERYEREPRVLLMPGRAALVDEPSSVEALLQLAAGLGDDELCCGDASCLDVGYDLWAAGYEREFLGRADQVRQALAHARAVVLLSPEALYALKVLYPRYDRAISAQLLHASEFILPYLSEAPVRRVRGRVFYHDSCHLVRHLGLADAPRQVLARVLGEPPRELVHHRDEAICCGATGCLTMTRPEASREMASRVVGLAIEQKAERLVSFSPECVAQMRSAAGGRLRVDDAVCLVARAVRTTRPA